jgi:hypothetical protein
VASRVGAGQDQALTPDSDSVAAGLDQTAARLGEVHDAKPRIEEDDPVGEVLQTLDHGTEPKERPVGGAARLPSALDPRAVLHRIERR